MFYLPERNLPISAPAVPPASAEPLRACTSREATTHALREFYCLLRDNHQLAERFQQVTGRPFPEDRFGWLKLATAIELPRCRVERMSQNEILYAALVYYQRPAPAPDAAPGDWYPAAWYKRASGGALYPDLLGHAYRDGRIRGRKVGHGFYNQYELASVCRIFPQHVAMLMHAHRAAAPQG